MLFIVTFRLSLLFLDLTCQRTFQLFTMHINYLTDLNIKQTRA